MTQRTVVLCVKQFTFTVSCGETHTHHCIISSLPVSDACGWMIKERVLLFHLSVCVEGELRL